MTTKYTEIVMPNVADPYKLDEGTKIKFSFPNHGKGPDRATANQYLILNTVYTVQSVAIDAFESWVRLKEVPGVNFNVAHFELV